MPFEDDCRYHSSFNQANYPSIASMMLLPYKNFYDRENKVKDIVDEAFNYFTRAMFAEGYVIRGDADRTLIYLFLFLIECCKQCVHIRDIKAAANKLSELVHKKILPIPGEAGFPFNEQYGRPKSDIDAYLLRSYLMQLGRECAERFVRLVFLDPDHPNEHLLSFGNKQFIGYNFKLDAA